MTIYHLLVCTDTGVALQLEEGKWKLHDHVHHLNTLQPVRKYAAYKKYTLVREDTALKAGCCS